MVRAMSARAIKNDHHLERIDHSCGKLLGQLTFVFTGEIRSPPVGSYDKEPTMREELPKGVHIGCMKFGKFEWTSQKGKEYQLIALEVHDDYGGMVTELKGFSRETN